jgi:uncharacterized membrane protein
MLLFFLLIILCIVAYSFFLYITGLYSNDGFLYQPIRSGLIIATYFIIMAFILLFSYQEIHTLQIQSCLNNNSNTPAVCY